MTALLDLVGRYEQLAVRYSNIERRLDDLEGRATPFLGGNELPHEAAIRADSAVAPSSAAEAEVIHPLGYKWVPPWFAEPLAVAFMNEWTEGQTLEEVLPLAALAREALAALAVPLIPWAFAMTALLWGFFAVFPLVCYSYVECPTGTETFATMPLQVNAMYLPFLAVAIAIEWRILQNWWVGQAESVGQMKILNVPVPFSILLMMALGLSFIGSLDLCTRSSFMVKAFKTHSCNAHQPLPPRQDVNQIWAKVMSESVLRYVGFNLVPFSSLIGVAWFLMFAQLLAALAYTIPKKRDDGHTFFVHNVKQFIDICHDLGVRSKYQPIVGDKIFHDDALRILADCNRMSGVKFFELSFTAAIAEMSTSWYLLFLMQRITRRFGLVGILENMLVLHLQISLFAMSRGASNGQHVDYQTLLSIVLSIFTSLSTMNSEVEKFRLLSRMVDKNLEEEEEEEETQEKEKSQEEYEEEEAKGEEEEEAKGVEEDEKYEKRTTSTSIKKDGSVRAFYALALTYVFMISWAVVKLIMAFFCEDAVWNFDGCVSLDQLTS